MIQVSEGVKEGRIYLLPFRNYIYIFAVRLVSKIISTKQFNPLSDALKPVLSTVQHLVRNKAIKNTVTANYHPVLIQYEG